MDLISEEQFYRGEASEDGELCDFGEYRLCRCRNKGQLLRTVRGSPLLHSHNTGILVCLLLTFGQTGKK